MATQSSPMPAVGQSVKRKDGIGKATGRTRYADDIVLPEMLTTYTRLESIVDSQNQRALSLLQGLGFTVEPPAFHESSGRQCHRVWIEADAASLVVPTRPTLLN